MGYHIKGEIPPKKKKRRSDASIRKALNKKHERILETARNRYGLEGSMPKIKYITDKYQRYIARMATSFALRSLEPATKKQKKLIHLLMEEYGSKIALNSFKLVPVAEVQSHYHDVFVHIAEEFGNEKASAFHIEFGDGLDKLESVSDQLIAEDDVRFERRRKKGLVKETPGEMAKKLDRGLRRIEERGRKLFPKGGQEADKFYIRERYKLQTKVSTSKAMDALGLTPSHPEHKYVRDRVHRGMQRYAKWEAERDYYDETDEDKRADAEKKRDRAMADVESLLAKETGSKRGEEFKSRFHENMTQTVFGIHGRWMKKVFGLG